MLDEIHTKEVICVSIFNPKNDNDYRRIAEKVGRGEYVDSIDRADYERYKRQCGSVPRELQRIEDDARRETNNRPSWW